MIDSILLLGPGTKAGDLSTIVADFDKTDLARFARKSGEASADALDTSCAQRVRIITRATGSELAGFAALVSTEDQRIADLLWALPYNVCRVQFDRALGKIIRSRIQLATLRSLSFEPVPAGSNYDFANIDTI